MTNSITRILNRLNKLKPLSILAATCVLLASCGDVGLISTLPTLSSPADTIYPTPTAESIEMHETAVAQDDIVTVDTALPPEVEERVEAATVVPAVVSTKETAEADEKLSPPAPPIAPIDAADRPIRRDDGVIPFGETLSPFDIDHPAIKNLDPDLLAAVQRATTDAHNDGFEMFVTSGWRSARYQQSLLDEAIVNYGSLEEARKWVKTPEDSTHVTGRAVDIGPTDAMSWLSQHGIDYGLCQTYANEMWHYELATEPGGVCPEQLSDASTR